eukprot:IDg22602t1
MGNNHCIRAQRFSFSISISVNAQLSLLYSCTAVIFDSRLLSMVYLFGALIFLPVQLDPSRMFSQSFHALRLELKAFHLRLKATSKPENFLLGFLFGRANQISLAI